MTTTINSKWNIEEVVDWTRNASGSESCLVYHEVTNGIVSFRLVGGIGADEPDLIKLCSILNKHWTDDEPTTH